MKRVLKITIILIAFLFLSPILLLAGQYPVVKVVDGDTIVVNYEGKHEKVRLLCVNTPESVHPDEKQNIPMGKIASELTLNRRCHTLNINTPFLM